MGKSHSVKYIRHHICTRHATNYRAGVFFKKDKKCCMIFDIKKISLNFKYTFLDIHPLIDDPNKENTEPQPRT